MKERTSCQNHTNSQCDQHTQSYYSPYTPQVWPTGGYYETCKCCCGSGVQTKCNGIRIVCPCCGGSGRRCVNYPCRPYYPQNPWCPTPYSPTIWYSINTK